MSKSKKTAAVEEGYQFSPGDKVVDNLGQNPGVVVEPTEEQRDEAGPVYSPHLDFLVKDDATGITYWWSGNHLRLASKKTPNPFTQDRMCYTTIDAMCGEAYVIERDDQPNGDETIRENLDILTPRWDVCIFSSDEVINGEAGYFVMVFDKDGSLIGRVETMEGKRWLFVSPSKL